MEAVTPRDIVENLGRKKTSITQSSNVEPMVKHVTLFKNYSHSEIRPCRKKKEKQDLKKYDQLKRVLEGALTKSEHFQQS